MKLRSGTVVHAYKLRSKERRIRLIPSVPYAYLVCKMNPAGGTISHLKKVVAESPNKVARAKWKEAEVSLLCHYAAEAVEMNLVAAGSLNKAGWKHVWDNFVPRFGKKYNLGQMKTKWRNLGKQYNDWKKLLSRTTGIGWDEEKGTLIADDDWWKSRIEEHPDLKSIRYPTLAQYHQLQRLFAPLKDFSKSGRATADFNSEMETESVGNGNDGDDPSSVSMSHSTFQGQRTSNMNDVHEEIGAGADAQPAAPAGPSSSKSSRVPRSLFKSPEFSISDKRKKKTKKEEEHMDRMVTYLTTGAKTELDKYGQFIKDPFDIGTVMKAVAELPGFAFGVASWKQALRYFERNQWACTSFLQVCTTMESKLEYIQEALSQ